MKYMLNMLQTKKLNEKYFVNKINLISTFTYQSIFLNGFSGARKCILLDCQMLLKKYIFKNIQKKLMAQDVLVENISKYFIFIKKIY